MNVSVRNLIPQTVDITKMISQLNQLADLQRSSEGRPECARVAQARRTLLRSCSADEVRTLAAVGVVWELNQPLSGSSFARWNGIALDVNSLFRNTLSAANSAVAAVSALRFVSALGLVFTGLSVLFNALAAGLGSFVAKDQEGGAEAAVSAGLGFSFSMFGAATAVPFISALQHGVNQLGRAIASGATPSGVVGALANGAGFAISVFVLILGLFGVRYVSQFRKTFAEEAGSGNGMAFLTEQICITEADKNALMQKRDATTRPADFELLRETQQLLQRKTNAFRRRVGEAGYQAVLRNDSDMVQIVDRESFKQLVKRVTLVAIGVLGLIAAFTPGVVIPSTLFAVSAVLWLSIDSSYIHNKFGDWLHQYIGQIPPALRRCEPQPFLQEAFAVDP